VTGIVLGKSSHLQTMAAKAPDGMLAKSRSKRFSRCTHNETARAKAYFLPFIELFVPGWPKRSPWSFLWPAAIWAAAIAPPEKLRV
jgi:hypothetical protein